VKGKSTIACALGRVLKTRDESLEEIGISSLQHAAKPGWQDGTTTNGDCVDALVGSSLLMDSRICPDPAHPVLEEPVSGSTGRQAMNAGNLRVSRVAFDRGTRPLHYHERACLSVMLAGSFTEHIAGRVIECQDAGVLVKPAGEPHRDSFAGSVQIIVEPEENAGLRLGERTSLFEEISYGRNMIAAAIGGRIARELERHDAFTTLAVEGLTLELLAFVLRAGRGPASVRVPDWLARTRERLDAQEPLPDVPQLANEAHVHPAYLARMFRRCYGVSLGQYARHVRLQWVARRLVESEDSLATIAIRAGFADQSHLTRAFRIQFGVTPGQYRLASGSPKGTFS
jgi:AraC family transcriptional regulator